MDNALDDDTVDWRQRSKCRGMHGEEPNDPFFPTKGGSALIVARMAKAVCNGEDGYPVCPVRQECLLSAMENGERFGIWGGRSERERQKLRKKPRRAWVPPKPKRQRVVARVQQPVVASPQERSPASPKRARRRRAS